MQHPERLLSTSGIKVALRLLRGKVEAFKKELPEFPFSALFCQLAMGPVDHTDRAATRDLPFTLLSLENLYVHWKMDENFARAMLATDFPKEHGLGGFRLPYPALWVSAPPVLKVMNHQTGLHDLEGFYLAEDWVPSRKKLMSFIGKDCWFDELDEGLMQVINQRYTDNLKRDPMSVLERAILVVMVGKPKVPVEVHRVDIGGTRVELPAMDDALISFWALTEDSFQAEENEEFLRLVFNLLIAIQSDYIEEEKVTPQQPRGSRRKAKAIRKGESFSPYSVIRLGRRAKTARSSTSGSAGGSGPDRIIRGHWNFYWVLDTNAKDHVVIDRRPREGKEGLCKIRKWIQPVIIGNPDPKVYLLRK